MRFLVWAVCCSLALVVGCSSSTPITKRSNEPLTAKQITEASRPAIVKVLTFDSESAAEPDRIGSGFIVSSTGRVATNLHVIFGREHIRVVLLDGRTFSVSEIVAVDSERDLVILQIPATELPYLALGDSELASAGDPVVAIGHPIGGLTYSVSDGLVASWRAVDETTKILQISAPISVGSSGGPVFNDRGEVIGVATAISREGQNLNFAVPSNYVKVLLDREGLGEPPAEFARRFAAPPKKGVNREVPVYGVDFLSECSDDTLSLVLRKIGAAIEVGAPLYNEGQHEACFLIYEKTHRALQQDENVCSAVRAALGKGLSRANEKSGFPEKAWALRDSFDGLIKVIVARAENLP